MTLGIGANVPMIMTERASNREVSAGMLRVAAQYDKIIARLTGQRSDKARPATIDPKTGH